MADLSDWPFDQPSDVAAVTDASVVDDGAPVLLVIHYAEDEDWAFLSGGTFDMARSRLVTMGSMLRRDPTLSSIADLPPGWTAIRPDVGDPWTRTADPGV